MNYNTENAMLCYDSLESELETQSAWCPQLYWGCAINQPTRPWTPPLIQRSIGPETQLVKFIKSCNLWY